jgi:NAD(P)-dependent dehydrogenase (short-subunit alcohol dehydrogenase family)
MSLENKNAVVYGAGGAVGGAVARAFARDGAHVFLTGRNVDALDTLAKEIVAAGGSAELAQVDALDEDAVGRHLDAVVASAGSVDVSFNAIGIPQPGIQGIPLVQLAVDSFVLPIITYTKAHFVTAQAAARRMVPQGAGVIMMHTPEPARLGAPLVGGMGPTWAAMEGFNRSLSAEIAAYGVRAVCLRTTGMVETSTIDVVFGLHAQAIGITADQFADVISGMTHRKRPTALTELADVAAFVASDQAASMTGTVVNLTGGIIVD